MSIIAKDEKGASIPPLPTDVYMGTCYAIVDLGVQYSEKFDKRQQKVQIIWKIAGEKVIVGDEELDRTISKEYSLSLNEKSNLTKDLEAWRGKKFSDEELQGFDLINILNKSCQISILESEKNGKKYNDIAGIMALAKGMQAQVLTDTMVFDLTDNSTWNKYKDIPKWIQDKIKKAENYEASGLKAYVEDNKLDEAIQEADDFVTISNDEELPF